MKTVDTSKLVKIRNYKEGVGGNMLVMFRDTITPITVTGPDGRERDVEVLICTATITDETALNVLEEHVDKHTPCNRIILVSKKFKKLNNTVQLVLLEIENQKCKAELDGCDNNMIPLVRAEIAAIEKFGMVAEWFAVTKARSFRERSQRKAARGLHKQYKKDLDLEKNMAKVAKTIFRYEEKKEAKEANKEDKEINHTPEPVV